MHSSYNSMYLFLKASQYVLVDNSYTHDECYEKIIIHSKQTIAVNGQTTAAPLLRILWATILPQTMKYGAYG